VERPSITPPPAYYTPTSGYAGADSFTYTASNAGGTSNSATVSITVLAPSAPIAGTTTVSAPYGAVSYAITPNLSGTTATSLTVGNLPSHGSITTTGTTFYYTATSGYSGADSFTYTASNAFGASNSATVNITVMDQQDPNELIPVAFNASQVIRTTAILA
jgi:hypothetical protein